LGVSEKHQRLLIIRFSSFGDIIQATGVPQAFRLRFPQARVDWLVRSDFLNLLSSHPAIDEVLAFDKQEGLGGLIRYAWKLGDRGYTHVYDAHSNLRSRVVTLVLRFRSILQQLTGRDGSYQFAKRSKQRLRRLLFFRFGMKTLPQPYRGAKSFHEPLKIWGLDGDVPQGPQFFTDTNIPENVMAELEHLPRPWVALAPSAAWEMKRWPLDHWRELIRSYSGASFLLLGGKEDVFLEDLKREAPDRCANLAGRLKLSESSALLKLADLVIANDTGLLHVADQMERPTIALIGPTAFGYPSHPTSRTLEVELPCKPCSKDGRGGCVNSLYKRCLVEIEPARVIITARSLLETRSKSEAQR
jgi:heptosyltransferase-2